MNALTDTEGTLLPGVPCDKLEDYLGAVATNRDGTENVPADMLPRALLECAAATFLTAHNGPGCDMLHEDNFPLHALAAIEEETISLSLADATRRRDGDTLGVEGAGERDLWRLQNRIRLARLIGSIVRCNQIPPVPAAKEAK